MAYDDGARNDNGRDNEFEHIGMDGFASDGAVVVTMRLNRNSRQRDDQAPSRCRRCGPLRAKRGGASSAQARESLQTGVDRAAEIAWEYGRCPPPS